MSCNCNRVIVNRNVQLTYIGPKSHLYTIGASENHRIIPIQAFILMEKMTINRISIVCVIYKKVVK